ncbi:MAG: rhomboid family intramembrane serine protease [Bacteroidota bacterium]|nr:rhomboid family intramembrane serine protease [Bacteroidota bacterium]
MDVKEENYRKRMNLGQDGNALVQLLVLNAVIFVALKFIYVFFLMANASTTGFITHVYDWFVLPANPEKLAWRPWTLISFMFTDLQLLRFISNMFWLWCFGYILQDLTGNRKLIPIYLYGGLSGAIIFVLAHLLIPDLRAAINTDGLTAANCSIAAVAVATTVVSPDYRIFPMISGGIPLWILTLIFLLLNFSGIDSGGMATYLAYAGGALTGWLFIYLLRRGMDGSIWINQFFDWFGDLFNPEKKKKPKNKKDEFYYNVAGTQPYKKIPNITQKRIDEILDKINQQGYRFLTSEEKEILKRAAEEEDL